VYIQSCIQETQWKANLGENFILIEQPSRRQAAKRNLIEKEAFYCYEYLPIKEYLQNKSVLSKIHLAHRNPIGRYEPLILAQFPNLLDNRKAFQDLKRQLTVENQFRINSNRAYYPENYLNGFNAVSVDRKEDLLYQKDIRKARAQIFEWFLFFTLAENN
ncbi:MAG: hypothetical protein LIO65_04040, partial [Odoribacter sp.]|nr:hypothetical protein [Odoribacter sp.]